MEEKNHRRNLSSLNMIVKRFQSLTNPSNIEGMAHYGIRSARVYGISMPVLRTMAKEIGKNHQLALQLWAQGSLEARILAALIDDPSRVTARQMEQWVSAFDNWAVCDQCCSSLFDKTIFGWKKAFEWSRRQEEFVRRAGFVLMAVLAVHDKETDDRRFLEFLPAIAEGAADERTMVKKAINWALRQIGKRSRMLNTAAIRTAVKLQRLPSPSSRWIAADALRELRSEQVMRKVGKKLN